MRILLIDGDIRSVNRLKKEIQEHYLVDVAFDGNKGDYMAQVNDYAAIVIESNLPDINNAELCQKTRENEVTAPILVLLEQGDLDQIVRSYDCGADAILTKPVEVRELKACLRTMIKRSYHKPGKNTLQVGDLELNMRTRKVVRAGKEISLRRKEYEILECLMLNAGNIVSKEALLEHVWDYGFESTSNTLEVHIKNLRDKVDRPFETKLIKTVRGFGYKICE